MAVSSTESLMRNVRLLEALRSARQIAYEVSREDASLQPWYERAEAAYGDFAAQAGVDPEPVFDEDAYRERMAERGHPDFVTSPKR